MRELFQVINDYPWTAFFVALFVYHALALVAAIAGALVGRR